MITVTGKKQVEVTYPTKEKCLMFVSLNFLLP